MKREEIIEKLIDIANSKNCRVYLDPTVTIDTISAVFCIPFAPEDVYLKMVFIQDELNYKWEGAVLDRLEEEITNYRMSSTMSYDYSKEFKFCTELQKLLRSQLEGEIFVKTNSDDVLTVSIHLRHENIKYCFKLPGISNRISLGCSVEEIYDLITTAYKTYIMKLIFK